MRQKNAIREHYLAPYDATAATTPPDDTDYLPLDHWITTIEDASEESTEGYADYAGDGNEVESITSISEAWTFEGTYDSEDATHAFLKGLKRPEPGEDVNVSRMCWHKIVETDGATVEGVARITDLVVGGGDAQDYEALSGTISYTATPTVTPKATSTT